MMKTVRRSKTGLAIYSAITVLSIVQLALKGGLVCAIHGIIAAVASAICIFKLEELVELEKENKQ